MSVVSHWKPVECRVGSVFSYPAAACLVFPYLKILFIIRKPFPP